MILLATLALAAPLRLATGAGSTAEVLPVVEPGRVEVLIRDADRTTLGEPFGGEERPDGIRAGRVTDFGGHLVVTAWMRRPRDTLALTRTPDGWEARPTSRAETAWSMPATCDGRAETPLLPLHGADMLAEVPDAAVRPTVARWELAEPAEASWERVDLLRAQTFGGSPGPERARNLYALGAIHRDLGHAREAAHYFREAVTAGAPADVVSFQAAAALLEVRDYDGARALLRAVEGGAADDRTALEGMLALRTGVPAPLPTARALAERAGRTDLAVLSGALMLRANCWAEAGRVLEPHARGDDVRAPYAALLLAEARTLTGDLDDAGVALGRIEQLELSGALRSIVRARGRLVAIAKDTPGAWAGSIPTLDAVGRVGDSPEALDALYLRAQIAETLGDDDQALEAYVALVDRRRALLGGEPGERLLAVWKRRVETLFDAGRDLDALVTHLGAWRPGLGERLLDPGPLPRIADTWTRQGMFGEALDVLAEVAALQAIRGLDDRATVLAIADAYRQTGRLDEALETLDFLGSRSSPRDAVAARALLLRGRTLADRGELPAARGAWTTLVSPPRGRGAMEVPPEVAADAALRLALADAAEGRCAPLLALADTPPPADLSPAWLDAQRSTCLAKGDRPDEAREAARKAAAGFVDPAAAAWARGLAGEPAGVLSKKLVADDLAEDAADAAMRARLDALRGLKP